MRPRWQRGVFVVNGDRCVVEGCTVIGKELPEVRRGDSIRLWYSSGCRLIGNRIERSRDLVIWYSANTAVEDNTVRTSRYGLHYMYSDHNVFHRNRFEDNQVGAAIMYSRGIDLSENAFSFSNGPAAYGLLGDKSCAPRRRAQQSEYFCLHFCQQFPRHRQRTDHKAAEGSLRRAAHNPDPPH